MRKDGVEDVSLLWTSSGPRPPLPKGPRGGRRRVCGRPQESHPHPFPLVFIFRNARGRRCLSKSLTTQTVCPAGRMRDCGLAAGVSLTYLPAAGAGRRGICRLWGGAPREGPLQSGRQCQRQLPTSFPARSPSVCLLPRDLNSRKSVSALSCIFIGLSF